MQVKKIIMKKWLLAFSFTQMFQKTVLLYYLYGSNTFDWLTKLGVNNNKNLSPHSNNYHELHDFVDGCIVCVMPGLYTV